MLIRKRFKISFLSLIIILSFSTSLFSQIINDMLQGYTIGTQVGGTFTSEGYRPGLGVNHIRYVVPIQINNGYVEFEMKGFWPGDIAGSNNDHGFIIMYDGRGIGNFPTWDEFRDNYFRWNFHWRQNASVFKCVVNCAAPTSLRLNSTYAVFIEDINGDGVVDINDRDWYDEPNGTAFSWNSNKNQWYKVKIEWLNKTFKVFVDNNLVWINHRTGLYDYVPKDLRIWLGSGVDKYNSDVSDVVYRNFKLFSYGVQSPSYQATLANDAMIGNNVYEFDIFLRRIGDTPFELSSCQIGLTFLDNIRNGGTLSAIILPGTSQLSNSAQIPDNPTVNTLVGTKRVLKIAPKSLPGAGAGSIISSVSPGTRLGRFRITNSTNFAAVRANLDWTFLDTEYRTVISSYVTSTSLNITSPPSHINNLDNPFLPVELSSFTANANMRSVNIMWSTITEVNSSVFEIERTLHSDPSWVKVGEVAASGNSSSLKEYSFTDKNLNSGKYFYRLKMIDADGTFEYSKIIEIEIALPKNYAISQNYPNPFNPTTKIDYQLPFDSKVTLELFGISGEKVATLVNTELSAGYYSLELNTNALKLASGVYFYRFTAQSSNSHNFNQIKKLILSK